LPVVVTLKCQLQHIGIKINAKIRVWVSQTDSYIQKEHDVTTEKIDHRPYSTMIKMGTIGTLVIQESLQAKCRLQYSTYALSDLFKIKPTD